MRSYSLVDHQRCHLRSLISPSLWWALHYNSLLWRWQWEKFLELLFLLLFRLWWVRPVFVGSQPSEISLDVDYHWNRLLLLIFRLGAAGVNWSEPACQTNVPLLPSRSQNVSQLDRVCTTGTSWKVQYHWGQGSVTGT